MAKLVTRSPSLTIEIFNNNSCDGSGVNNGPLNGDGSCFNFAGQGLGSAVWDNPNSEQCNFVFFSGQGCTGNAVQFEVGPGSDQSCVSFVSTGPLGGVSSARTNCPG